MKAYQYIPSHVVAIFSILTPVYVVLIHNLMKRTFLNRYVWVALLSVLGAASIKVKSVPDGDIWIGFGLMQVAGIAFAFGQVAYRNWKKANAQVVDQAVFGLLAFGGFICVGGFSLLLTDFTAVEITLNQWQSIIYLGCVASGLGFFLWNKGATRSNPGTLAAFNNAVVPLAVIISLLVFGESEALDLEDSLRLFVGSALIVGAAIFSPKES
tara:strand:+ start:2354 stop:2989 length:636 start_codon:yes stop_codon:yes gene_type:complete